MRKIKAIFVGRNGSEGYIKDMQYTLHIDQSDKDGSLTVTPENKIGRQTASPVKYQSFFGLLNNWDEIRTVL